MTVEVIDIGHGLVKVRDSSWPETSGCPLPRAEWDAFLASVREEVLATCSCQSWPPDGPAVDCPVHGAVRAFNEASAQLAAAMRVVDAARAWQTRKVWHTEGALEAALHLFDTKAPLDPPESTQRQDHASGDHADTPAPGNDATATATTEGARAIPGAPGAFHSGRSWSGHWVEDRCPCPQQPCGLVILADAHPDCLEHPIWRAKTIRQSHLAVNCPAVSDVD